MVPSSRVDPACDRVADFNTVGAQREAGEHFIIKNQAAHGRAAIETAANPGVGIAFTTLAPTRQLQPPLRRQDGLEPA